MIKGKGYRVVRVFKGNSIRFFYPNDNPFAVGIMGTVTFAQANRSAGLFVGDSSGFHAPCSLLKSRPVLAEKYLGTSSMLALAICLFQSICSKLERVRKRHYRW